uniref:Uncharacterized protein n=1 Tax=Oryza meridionalis TaxID=40149 RepID=A0A0E0F0I0_9ORYZ
MPPNGDAGVDGMRRASPSRTSAAPSVPRRRHPAVRRRGIIAHELAELATNLLLNAWYAGEDPTAPTEIADLCEGVYGTVGGGSYAGKVAVDAQEWSWNVNGRNGRRFLVQWLWSPVAKSCVGPNASD